MAGGVQPAVRRAEPLTLAAPTRRGDGGPRPLGQWRPPRPAQRRRPPVPPRVPTRRGRVGGVVTGGGGGGQARAAAMRRAAGGRRGSTSAAAARSGVGGEESWVHNAGATPASPPLPHPAPGRPDAPRRPPTHPRRRPDRHQAGMRGGWMWGLHRAAVAVGDGWRRRRGGRQRCDGRPGHAPHRQRLPLPSVRGGRVPRHHSGRRGRVWGLEAGVGVD